MRRVRVRYTKAEANPEAGARVIALLAAGLERLLAAEPEQPDRSAGKVVDFPVDLSLYRRDAGMRHEDQQ